MYICYNRKEETLTPYGNREVLSKGTGLCSKFLAKAFRAKSDGTLPNEFKNERFWIVRADLITSKRN